MALVATKKNSNALTKTQRKIDDRMAPLKLLSGLYEYLLLIYE